MKTAPGSPGVDGHSGELGLVFILAGHVQSVLDVRAAAVVRRTAVAARNSDIADGFD